MNGQFGVPKPTRIKDKNLLRSYHGKPCEVISCGKTEGTVAHHMKTRGAGGDDKKSNLVALCPYHHNIVHQIGRVRFLEKHKI